jgi:hypothetical protein
MPVSCEVYVDCAAIGLETHKLKRKSANAIPQQFRKPRSTMHLPPPKFRLTDAHLPHITIPGGAAGIAMCGLTLFVSIFVCKTPVTKIYESIRTISQL